jgi:hypothetical protein
MVELPWSLKLVIMAISENRKYQKGNPEKQTKEKQFVSPSFIPEKTGKVFSVNERYQKKESYLDPFSFIVVVSGGEKTERSYFKIISNKTRFPLLKIEFNTDPTRLNPKGLLEFALERKKYYQSSNESSKPDDIYLISDVDDYLSELIGIKEKCQSNNISLIISNSCFEIWLYYAYYSEIPNMGVPLKVDKISRTFRQWMPSNVNPVRAILNIEKNIENAKKHYREDEKGFPILFTTNMFVLAENILPYIKENLQILIHQDKIRIDTKRKR